MKIISIAHNTKDGHDFAMCVIDDDNMAAIHYARCKTANHQGLYSIAVFSPDNPGDLLAYILRENDAAQTRKIGDGNV